MKYYFEHIDRIKEANYLATQQDIILSRVRTSGIVTERYEIDDSQFEMYDVGGQRNERKKWIHCFDDVTAVIFVAALSEYVCRRGAKRRAVRTPAGAPVDLRTPEGATT